MHQIDGDTNKELLAFIASALSYGSRKQFLPKIQTILDHINTTTKGDVAKWLITHEFDTLIPPHSTSCFYRLYNNEIFNRFLTALSLMIDQYKSIKAYLQANMKTRECLEAVFLISNWFHTHNSSEVIPKVPEFTHEGLSNISSCKRICMFLRWMVRTNSPVDLGLWDEIIDRRTLIIPMDTHVVQESMRLGLLASKSTSMSNAIKLSQKLAEIFPDDPIKGDFALFGIGVDKNNS